MQGWHAELTCRAGSARQAAQQAQQSSHLLDQAVGVALDAAPGAEVGAAAPRPLSLEQPVGGVDHILQPEQLLTLTRLGWHNRCRAREPGASKGGQEL